jgi:hypothetical protein
MSQARTKVVGGARREDLGLARQPAKGTRLHNAFAVSLERGSTGMRWRGKDSSEEQARCVVLNGTRIVRVGHENQCKAEALPPEKHPQDSH